jgi:hypothetical protein
VHNFDAETEDELTFIIGEPIVVIQKDDGFGDGWWKVKKLKINFLEYLYQPLPPH